MDFYTSPIIIEVDGVDVRLKIASEEAKIVRPIATQNQHESSSVVPNTADLAQSFLATEPLSEKSRLEAALVAGSHDLGGSATVSDDESSEDDSSFGTGQPLSLPGFLTGFLQGVVDRTQVMIKNVTFQLALEVPAELNSSRLEPISVQISLGQIEVEGVTSRAGGAEDVSGHREGKRHLSLSDIRASLVSEVDSFAGLSRSPSTVSNSLVSSPASTRNPPSREATFLSQGSFHVQPMATLQQTFRERLSDDAMSDDQDSNLADSEDALAIPFDLSHVERVLEEDPEGGSWDHDPSTPRASAYLDPQDVSTHSAIFHSTVHSAQLPPPRDIQIGSRIRESVTAHASDHFASAAQQIGRLDDSHSNLYGSSGPTFPRKRAGPAFVSASVDDLTQSRLYTHAEAESMYMSAYSQASEPRASFIIDRTQESDLAEDLKATSITDSLDITPAQPMSDKPLLKEPDEGQNVSLLKGSPTSLPVEQVQRRPVQIEQGESRRPTMPGAWDDDADSHLDRKSVHTPRVYKSELGFSGSDSPKSGTDSTGSSPAFRKSSLLHSDPEKPFVDVGPLADDGTATPKGQPKVIKEILRLQNVSIYLQQQQQHGHVPMASSETADYLSQSLGRSSLFTQVPGAFSGRSSDGPVYKQPLNQDRSETVSHGSVEVVLSPITIDFDASIVFLLAMIVERLYKAASTTTPPSKGPSVRDEKPGSAPRVQITAEEIVVNFLNRLGGIVNPMNPHDDGPSFDNDQEVLLSMNILDLRVSSTPLPTNAKLPMAASRAVLAHKGDVLTKIEMGKFRVGYAKGDILSFDSTRQLSTSIRDSFISAGHDVGVEILQSGDATRTSIETLPLLVQVDLQRLDETLWWFGGLGSFLNMSASVTSSSSPNPKSGKAKPASKTRGVRFETPIDPQDKSATSQNKLNLRIGGLLLELVGKDCSVAAETSALKLVSRDQGIGASCSRLRISGPYLNKSSSADPSVVTNVENIRVELLTTPKDSDLEKLLELIIPSKVKFDHENDEVMVDTLLRQRRKGSVLRVSLEKVTVFIKNVAQLSALPSLGEELAKLAVVTKYLPEDDRPGLLTLTQVRRLSFSCDLPDHIGHIGGEIRDLEVGQITVPSLVAVAIHGISVWRNSSEELVGSSSLENSGEAAAAEGPVLMVRVIGDEIEPVIKLKLQDLRFEYRVVTIMDFLNLGSDATPQDFESSLAASVANLGDQAHAAFVAHHPTATAEQPPSLSASNKPTTLDIGLRDCMIGLNPYRLPSKMVVVLTDAKIEAVLPESERTKVSVGINKASILLTDDAGQIETSSSGAGAPRARSSSATSRQVDEMCARGYVDICYMSSASVVASIIPDPNSTAKIEIEVRDDLLVLETCADSTQTLITLANALKPPTPPSKEDQYRTKVMPMEDLLASISAEAFGRPEGEYDFDQDFAGAQEMAGSITDDEEFDSEGLLAVDSQFSGSFSQAEELFDATKSLEVSQEALTDDTKDDAVVLAGFGTSQNAKSGNVLSQSTDELVVHDDFYGSSAPEMQNIKIWKSSSNSYERAPSHLVGDSPIKISVRDVHVIWNLFDGYDWAKTRDVITKAVEDVEIKATERQTRRPGNLAFDEEAEDEETIGDFLFNSIYIGIPSSRDPKDLTRAINEGLHDNATETESVFTTTMTMNTNRTARRTNAKTRRLRLSRSKHHKITFELKGINADMVMFPPDSGETVSSVDARVENLDIFDHVPTSTWKKFATYDQDHGEREMGASMIHLELLNVRPLPHLAASEMVARATILPLRLHVDQDALDFITRFFEFKDDKIPVHASPSDVPFLQRIEVMDIPVKLDFKPKRVDYGGLRSGHTTEFMNFIVLEESRMVLRHVIIYGVAGFDRLGKTLNDIWMPDVRTNQLPGVIAGLAPVRSFVNIGSGFRDLVEIPLREYRRDGRVMRSLSKGAVAFARTTGTELVKLGAKLAVGTQYALQGAEGLLTERGQAEGTWEDDDLDPEDKKQISLYADQPTGVLQGIRGGFRSLTRDVTLARDAIIAVPGEVMAMQSAVGAAKAVLNRAPTIIFRPAMGVTKVIGQTLMGATNSLDQENRRRISEVSDRGGPFLLSKCGIVNA